MKMMKAAVIYEAGGPEVLKIEERPIATPKIGEVLIRVESFGLNRSELFTRQGHSPNVPFPRILGIEAAGIVEKAPGGEFEPGDVVVTAMGGMGRDFDGGYAEFTCVPVTQVQKIKTDLGWDVIGAAPEMLQTAWGSLFTSLQLQSGDTLLVRGGTTSVGLAAAALAKQHGAIVVATTRNAERRAMLLANGADYVVIDNGFVAAQVREIFPEGVNKTLELVGTTTLADSLQAAAKNGVVCMTGMVGDKWAFDNFSPMGVIPTSVSLTTYSGGAEDFMNTPLQSLLDAIKAGVLPFRVGKKFLLDDIVEAHRTMESNSAGGKIVVLT